MKSVKRTRGKMSHLKSSVDTRRQRLRLITYLSPSIPFALYSLYQQYLDEVLHCDTYLMSELRWSCPPPLRADPFTEDIADIGFFCPTGYLRLLEEGNPYIELIPAAPIHIHEENTDLEPIFFAQIVIPKSKASTTRDIDDLEGCRWAYADEESLSASVGMLAQLKRMGHDSSFFGQLVHSGSNHNSLQLIAEGSVDAASVDSNGLIQWQKEHPDLKDKVHLLRSLGPLPISPVVANSRLSAELKTKITDALLNMHKIPHWQERLSKHHFWGFKPIDQSFYDKENEIKELVKDFIAKGTYY